LTESKTIAREKFIFRVVSLESKVSLHFLQKVIY